MDKEHDRASLESRSEHTSETPRRCAQQPGDQAATPYLAAPATADIIIGPTRPSSIDRPQSQSLKWNRRRPQRQRVSFGARPR